MVRSYFKQKTYKGNGMKNEKTSKEFKRNETNYKAWIFIGIGFITFLIIFYFYMVNKFYPEQEAQALFGNSFGAFNSLITGLTFVLIWVSIKQTQDELKDNRIDRQTQMEIANKHVFATSAENTISNILEDLQSKIKCVKYFFEDENKSFDNLKLDFITVRRVIEEIKNDKYKNYFNENNFHNLKNKLKQNIHNKYIDETGNNHEDAEKHSQICSSQAMEFLELSEQLEAILQKKNELVVTYSKDKK